MKQWSMSFLRLRAIFWRLHSMSSLRGSGSVEKMCCFPYSCGYFKNHNTIDSKAPYRFENSITALLTTAINRIDLSILMSVSYMR